MTHRTLRIGLLGLGLAAACAFALLRPRRARFSDAQERLARRWGIPTSFQIADGHRFVLIPAGRFTRVVEGERYEVRISLPYYMQASPLPWTGVATDAALAAYAAEVSARNAPWQFRLVREAEWEHGMRAGAEGGAAAGGHVPPGAAPRNAWGVAAGSPGLPERCSDWFGPLANFGVADPRGPKSGQARVLRTGLEDRRPARADEPFGLRLVAPVGYGLGAYGRCRVRFIAGRPGELLAERGAPTRYALIRMEDRLAERDAGLIPRWAHLPVRGTSVETTLVPGRYYVLLESGTRGTPGYCRGDELKFTAEDQLTLEVPLPKALAGGIGASTPQ